jgi:hypothetical protein
MKKLMKSHSLFTVVYLDANSDLWRHEQACSGMCKLNWQTQTNSLCLIGWCNRIEDETFDSITWIHLSHWKQSASVERTWTLSTYFFRLDPLPISWKGAPDETHFPKKIRTLLASEVNRGKLEGDRERSMTTAELELRTTHHLTWSVPGV